ncbi:type I restriction-modification system endonuclease [Corynebacterium striatum]|uniref:type I restriction-modification system endonuclease n=2 Tax=Corynebacterium striatum TaxID=43770 RepID=UPI001A327A4A|nr:type I restriction-modification system endonuclease [Corynebacterium striatum]HAT1177252.1 type I restriction-modification system endonuclease [Corynebacterium striatum]HAT1329464.1 type I restriction-modification system endonuclease [Corynebacterium striatum]HAT1331948.1 type I restriction-modification system endonuclease [Corynebacterium striatum]HAT1339319.1 type I restriction-modification system endonuclease [Corynebacterium striatum]
MSNFGFLNSNFPSLENLGTLAETYLYTDPNTSMMKLGLLCESIIELIYQYDRVYPPRENTAVKRIDTLAREGLLPREVVDILHLVRKARNKAAHEHWGTTADVQRFLPMVHSLAWWFAATYGDPHVTVTEYVLPARQAAPVQPPVVLESEAEALATRDESAAQAAQQVSKAERSRRSLAATNQRPKTEAETRLLIDEQLRQVGWDADTEHLRYRSGARPREGVNQAIAEWPTNSRVGNHGRADYALFVGLRLVGVIEAKAEHTAIPSVLDYQAADYGKLIKAEHDEYTLGRWGEFKVPFLFATNGRPYIEQYKTQSGVWFHDVRDPLNTPRALVGWPSPQGLLDKLDADQKAAQRALDNLGDDLLTSSTGLSLRDYQVDAIHAAEEVIKNGETHALLAMATGTGKTRTVLGMIYRFLKTDRFRRILFLVDRTALGTQAMDTFKDVRLEELLTLDELYSIKGLEESGVDPETRVHVSTVQGMVKRLFYPEPSKEGEQVIKPAVTDYDLIIVDEAHRGYLLDKEMTDDEALYRDQTDYQSAYRSVIDYFDATKIALTATPALHTTEIFGEPVFTYTYREAVMDGYLVDHDAPHRLTTKLSTEGIHFAKGDTLPIYDASTGEITNSAELADEVTFDVEDFNRSVITESFNRTVLAEIARDLDPSMPELFGKTLIYAVDDAHADLIVSILKEIYASQGVEPEAIMKITGSVAGGNKKKIEEAIKRFKNERYPSIVVTVDLLTTGIDVPAITTLVFMRRVKSRILFEQMLGRATRLCPEIEKDRFEIYDPVGVYDALEKVSTMKPLAANPNTTFKDLIEGIELAAGDDDKLNSAIEQVVAKLQRRRHKISGNTAEHTQDLAGGRSIAQVIEELRDASPARAAAWIQTHSALFDYLDNTRFGEPRRLVISNEADELLEHTRDFGDAKEPKDYLEEFSTFIKNNTNEIAALRIICTRPSDLTRDELKSLKLELDREGFTEQKLSSALSQVSDKEITADIISLVRRFAIGSPLLTHEERVRRAIDKLKAEHKFTKVQLGWISRIESYLANELIISTDTFDTDARFRQQGGLPRVDYVFGGRFADIIVELNDHMYEEQTA